MKWWEKTVEYFFILNCVGNYMRVAPLDGKEERAGDAIFSKSNNWVLIEFKKDKSSLVSEKGKFNDYSAAKQNFQVERSRYRGEKANSHSHHPHLIQ